MLEKIDFNTSFNRFWNFKTWYFPGSNENLCMTSHIKSNEQQILSPPKPILFFTRPADNMYSVEIANNQWSSWQTSSVRRGLAFDILFDQATRVWLFVWLNVHFDWWFWDIYYNVKERVSRVNKICVAHSCLCNF